MFREKLREAPVQKSRKFMVNASGSGVFLKSTTGEHEQNGTGLCIYIRKEVMVWQQGRRGKELQTEKNM